MTIKLCAVCKENKTGRLMDEGWGKMLPVCTECLTSGRWRELLAVRHTTEPREGDTPDQAVSEAPPPKRRKKKSRK